MNLSIGLGWGLVHFLWQGAAIALVLAVALRLSVAPRLRHGLAVMALLSMPVCFVVTAMVWMPSSATVELQPVAVAPAVGRASGVWREPQAQLASLLPWLSGLWAAGVVMLGLYRLGGWWMTWRLRRQGVCAVDALWRRRMLELSSSMGVTQVVALLESSLVDVPVVLGWLRPVLLMPVGMLAGMPVAQVEAILLHELAHVYRRDALVNFVQAVVESLLFHHPAVWWVSRVIREEREKCCDDLVVAVQGDAYGYVSALLTLEERRANRFEPALAANGGDLMQRVKRLLGRPVEQTGGAGLAVSMGILVALFCAVGVAQELKGPWKNWLEQDVVYIIGAPEKAAFLALNSDEEREKFSEQFWKLRDPNPATPENEFKVQHYWRIRYANERFASKLPGWKTDLGRVYIQHGPPDEIEIHPLKKQSWMYYHLPGIGERVILGFTYKDGEYVWDSDPH